MEESAHHRECRDKSSSSTETPPSSSGARDIALAVVGSRGFDNYELFERAMARYVKEHGMPNSIVSGGANGVDSLAARWAKEKSLLMYPYLPNYGKYGRFKAPKMRNTQIVNHCTHMLAFPSADSSGTWDSVRKAKAARKPVTIWPVEKLT